MVLRAGFLKKPDSTFELMIYDKHRGKNTGLQCVEKRDTGPLNNCAYLTVCMKKFF
jgi:hypothetical protein